MSERKLKLWSGTAPRGDELERRLRQTLGITRAGGYRMVQDPWGAWVKVELARVREHIVKHNADPSRWRLVPLIVPTIKQASRHYEKGRGFTYEATLRVAHAEGAYSRVVFVKTVVDVTKGLVFASILSPHDSLPQRSEVAVKRERERAGSLKRTRPNPGGRVYMGTRDPDAQERPAREPNPAAFSFRRRASRGQRRHLRTILDPAHTYVKRRIR